MGQHGEHGPLVIRWTLLLGPAILAVPSPALACRLALILALDVSSSVDTAEDTLQRKGLAAALTSQDVVAAFLQSSQPVALSVFEWSGQRNQQVLLDWSLMSSRADIATAAATISGSRRQTAEYPTALGQALAFAAGLFKSAPNCAARTIDVSGDGRNNDGFDPALAYAHFNLDGVTVNGLAIETQGTAGTAVTAVPSNVADYYWEELLRGPGAFLEIANGYEDFERAMQRKLVRELGSTALSLKAPNQ